MSPLPSTNPRFSIVTPVYNPPPDVLKETIESVQAQTFAEWELILVDDASTDTRVHEVLSAAAIEDARVRVIQRHENGHIVVASNDGIAAARGEFIALLDHDDQLAREALYAMDQAIRAHPDVDYLYSDEDKLLPDGRFVDAFRKPVWSPERMRGHMYTCHLSVFRTDLVRKLGGFREGFEGSQDYDLVLRITERARKIAHVPEVLYHWRIVPGSTAGDSDAKPYAYVAARKAIQEHLERVGVAGTVEFGPVPGTYRIERELDPTTSVSVVIPTRGTEGFAWGERRVFVIEAVRSLLRHGGHDGVEIVVVYDVGTPEHILDELHRLAGAALRLVPYARSFNFSEKCNLGVLHSTGDVIVLLNDDIEIASDGFLVQLIAPLFEDGVGLTGANLRFSDNKVQHAGVAAYNDMYGHLFRLMLGDHHGPFNAAEISRECSALTGACVALLRSTYVEIGGMTEQLPVNYNDVDFSFKIARSGRRLVWVVNSVAYHFESQTRSSVVHQWEKDFMKNRWPTPARDPYVPEWGQWGLRQQQRKSRRRRMARPDSE